MSSQVAQPLVIRQGNFQRPRQQQLKKLPNTSQTAENMITLASDKN